MKAESFKRSFADGGFEMLEVGGVDRINPAEHHRMDFLETGERLGRGIALVGDGVADLDVGGGLDVGDEIADVARVQVYPAETSSG